MYNLPLLEQLGKCQINMITHFLLQYASINLCILLNTTMTVVVQTIKDQKKKQVIVIVLFVCLLGCFKIITSLVTCMHYIEHGINLEFRTDTFIFYIQTKLKLYCRGAEKVWIVRKESILLIRSKKNYHLDSKGFLFECWARGS